MKNLNTTYQGINLNTDELPIYLFENFINQDAIEHIITLAKPKLKPALVSDRNSGKVSKGRTNSLAWIKNNATPTIEAIVEKIANITMIGPDCAESMQVIYYNNKEEYKAHYDAYDLLTERGKRCNKKLGQRLITTITYLNDVEEGGETKFPKLNLTVKPKKGSMLLFHNCFNGTNKRDPNSLHQGCPVLKGEKWAFNIWFHEHPPE